MKTNPVEDHSDRRLVNNKKIKKFIMKAENLKQKKDIFYFIYSFNQKKGQHLESSSINNSGIVFSFSFLFLSQSKIIHKNINKSKSWKRKSNVVSKYTSLIGFSGIHAKKKQEKSQWTFAFFSSWNENRMCKAETTSPLK